MTTAPFTAGTAELRPAGYRGPRADILILLKQSDGMSVRDLASHLSLSLNATRHHLRELEDEGVVEHALEHHGVGAPMHAYRLSPEGHALFPRRYLEALLGMLSLIEASEGREAAVRILEAHFENLAKVVLERVGTASPGERSRIVTEALAVEGYMPEWQATGVHVGALTERNCAIQAVAERYPEICAAELRFLEKVLRARVERKSHILGGCAACEYLVHMEPDLADRPVVQLTPRPARPGVDE